MMNSKLIFIFLLGIFNGILGDSISDSNDDNQEKYLTFDAEDIRQLRGNIQKLKENSASSKQVNLIRFGEIKAALRLLLASIEDIEQKISSTDQASKSQTVCSEAITNNFSEIKSKLSSVDVIKGKIDELQTINAKFFGALNATLEKTIGDFHSASKTPDIDIRTGFDGCERESFKMISNFKQTFETNLKDVRDIVAKEDGTCEKLVDLTMNVEGILTNKSVKCEITKPPVKTNGPYDSCKAALNSGSKSSEAFDIKLPNTDFVSFKAFCMKDHTDGEIWTIIQKRHDGTVDFKESWENYKHGFGHPSGDYWIGLEKIYALTNSKRHQLWILMESKGGKYSIVYDNFVIGGEKEKYKIKSFGEFTSTTENIEKNCLNEEFEAAVDSGLSTGFWNPKKCFNLNEQVISGGKRQIKATLKKYPVMYVHMAIRPVD